MKSQPVFTSRTTKKTVKTKECNAASSSNSSTITNEEAEAKQEDEKECQFNNEVGEDSIKVESDEIEVHDDLIPKSEKNEEDDDHDHQIEKVIDEIATISDGYIEEIEEKPHDEEKMEEKPKENDVVVDVENADDEHHHEETIHDESGGDQEKGADEEKTSDDHRHEIIGDENNKVEEKAHDDQDNGDQVEEGSEELVAMQEAGNGNSATALTANKWPGEQGKKESPTAYNDVIEETASKLLEKRKNKVKALVGAFETVIDYESGASK